MRFHSAFALILAGLLVAPAALAAQSPSADHVDVTGRVVSDGSGAPIPAALVRVHGSDRTTLTNDDGIFVLRDVPTGPASLVVEQLGYANSTVTYQVSPEGEPLEVVLYPQPIVLENLEVMVDRLRARRYARGVAVTVLDARAFENQPPDLYWAIRLRGGLTLSSCSSRFGGTRNCVFSRGSYVIPTVRVDNQPFSLRLEDLSLYSTDEVYAVEIYQRGRLIHLFTRSFMNEIAMSPRPVSSIRF